MPIGHDVKLMASNALCPPEMLSYRGRSPMMDLVMIGIGIAFFALSLAYIKACDIL